MPRFKISKSIAHSTDMNYIDGEYKVDKIFQLAKQAEQSSIEIDFKFLWGLERSWNMFRRD